MRKRVRMRMRIGECRFCGDQRHVGKSDAQRPKEVDIMYPGVMKVLAIIDICYPLVLPLNHSSI